VSGDRGEATLAWLRTRRSVRAFTDEPVDRATLERVIEAATTAPSSTNRQPWRFSVVVSAAKRRVIVDAVRARTEAMKAIIRRSHHAEDFANYGDFFFEPLQTAAVIVVPQYRDYPDLIANLIESGGGDPGQFHTAGSMQAELCSTSAAIMALLLQTHAEGLGACWMAGPMVAKDEIHALLGVIDPWKMVGAIALGHPAAPPQPSGASPGAAPAPSPPARKPIARVVQWLDDAAEPDP
jgi:nitroreductase